MKKLLEFVLPFCFHEWETIETLDLYLKDPVETYCGSYVAELVDQHSPYREKYKTPVGKKFILQCKKCGDITSKTIMYND